MAGLDESFDGVFFTGYHAAAGSDTNPLSHTMSLKVFSITCNGKLLTEFDINAMIAAYYGVPVFFLSGDQGLCEAAKKRIANSDGGGDQRRPRQRGDRPAPADRRENRSGKASRKRLSSPKKVVCIPCRDRFHDRGLLQGAHRAANSRPLSGRNAQRRENRSL